MDGYFALFNGVSNLGAVPEIRTGASIQFEFRGTPSPTAGCAPPAFSLRRTVSTCIKQNVSRALGVADWIDGGAISATEWRKVNVPVAKLLDNAPQPCAADPWNLDRWAGGRRRAGRRGRVWGGRWGLRVGWGRGWKIPPAHHLKHLCRPQTPPLATPSAASPLYFIFCPGCPAGSV
jgi:hypothetical protein